MATTTINASVSAAIIRSGVDETFTAIHDAATAVTASNTGGDSINVAIIEASTTSNQYQTIGRGGFIFDTSVLGSGAVVNSATFKFYVTGKTDQLGGSGEIALVDFFPASNTSIITADFTDGVEIGINKQATNIAISAISTSAYNEWALNVDGLARVNPTSYSTFALRVEKDRADSAPTWASEGLSRIFGNVGSTATNPPQLVIDYTPGSGENPMFFSSGGLTLA